MSAEAPGNSYGFFEILKVLIGVPPPPKANPPSEFQSRVGEIASGQKEAAENARRDYQFRMEQEAREKQTRIFQFREHCMAICRESKIVELLEQARSGLKAVYPSAQVYQEWGSPDDYFGSAMRNVVTLTWGNTSRMWPIHPNMNESYNYIQFECNAHDDTISSSPSRKRKNSGGTEVAMPFTREEWQNRPLMETFILEAIRKPEQHSYYAPERGGD